VPIDELATSEAYLTQAAQPPPDFPGGIRTEEPTVFAPTRSPADQPVEGEVAQVVEIIDGDTIDVIIDGEEQRVRYVGINTPERDEPCYAAATTANEDLVMGRTVRLVRDVSDTDRYGRLLRYVYVGDMMVNEQLVANGWAEAVLYPPDDRYWQQFVMLEQAVENLDVGCHPTGIFDDGTYER